MTDIALDLPDIDAPSSPASSSGAAAAEPAAAAPLIELSTIDLGIITPMASEADSAVRFVDAVLAKCRGRDFKSVTLFIVLDKACRDNTRQLLEEHARQTPALRIVWAPENRGVVDAYVRGYRAALDHGCDWILEIDAGFSHDPENIPQFFDAMRQGYDCVFGSRFMPGGAITDNSFKRRLLSKGGTILANAVLGTRLADMTSGFEMFTRRTLSWVVNERGIHSRGPFFQTEIKAYCRNLRILELPIHYRAGSHDVGKSALTDSFKNLFRLWKLKRRGQL